MRLTARFPYFRACVAPVALAALAPVFYTPVLAAAADAKSPAKISVAVADFPLVDAVECTPRGGLPNVLAKLKTGKDVKVGYLGGSITAAPGWRVKSLQWLQEQYPQAKLSEIDAAIGGTGSDLGVFRVQRDVLQHKPDLLFVEFAVNDHGASPDQIQRCMEGIVRQTWQADPNTDICFVYTVSEPMLPTLKSGKYQRSASVMEGLATYYNIPSIHFGVEVIRLVNDGKVIFKGEKPSGPPAAGAPLVFSTDGVHPHVETGHQLYLEAIQRSFPSIVTASGVPAAHTLKPAQREDNWEKAKLVPITEDLLKGAWTKLDPATDNRAKSYEKRLPALWKATAPGAALEFTVEGSVVFAYDLVGPDGGLLNVEVDGQPTAKPVARIDGYCTYPRLSKVPLLYKDKVGRHQVKVTLSADAPDKAKILFPQNVPDMEKNPDKYKDNVWYLGGLLIMGDLVK